MRRVLFSAALSLVPKAPLLRRCVPSVATAASMGPLVVMEQRRLASHAALSSALRHELEEEQQRSEKPAKPELPAGWTLERKPGQMLFTMRKKHEDEEIVIRCLGEESGDDDVVSLDFDAYITCNNKALVCRMSFESEEVIMGQVSFLDDAGLALDDSVEGNQKRQWLYKGPKLDELDERLVDSLTSYLKDRGVNEDLCRFMEEYFFWAEQAEYEEWLSAISRFVS
ncbi:p22 protein precursor [Trypanosoma cruzi]|uniref:Putative p22 protein n=1 Tax=Trypanosoma cruzi TaxID=5693 RepID=A0A2V2V561_TRYCR|nr:putative p22 protein precursor [Trypanosoma cruzi]RNF24960.1 p22 protein precursor [Trypanosoma cruzi]